MRQKPNLVTGASVLVYVNGLVYGAVASFTFTSLTPRQKRRTIDTPVPAELVATTADVNWSMTVLRSTLDGGMQGAGIVAPQAYISSERYFSLVLVDRRSKLPLFQSAFNQTDSESWQVAPRAIVVGQIAGAGLLWSNEAG